jgi:hypothetical protein
MRIRGTRGEGRGGGDLDEQSEWNEKNQSKLMGDNQLKMEDDTQLEAYDHSVITPLK